MKKERIKPSLIKIRNEIDLLIDYITDYTEELPIEDLELDD